MAAPMNAGEPGDGEGIGALLADFALLSLLAIGGMTGVIPEMQRTVVDSRHWMDARTFADLYGLGYAMPGPNVLVVTLVGYAVAGAAGALAATAAMIVPSMLLAFAAAGLWNRRRETAAGRIVRAGLLPVTAGLALAGGYLITRGADHSAGAFLLTAATVVGVMKTRIHPLWMIAGGAGLGLAGLV